MSEMGRVMVDNYKNAIAERDDEIARLAAKVKELEKVAAYIAVEDALVKVGQRKAMQERIAALEEGLRKYGQHKAACSCRFGGNEPCDCGLRELEGTP